jgi:HD-GYP domain-containing protein (c-di-GMP phosphodiesterase class II)
VRHHHERFDGKGYPDGIAGEDIPLGARILAVADSYEAMMSDRPYRKALPVVEAVKEIETNAGTQFDPVVVKAFMEAIVEQEEKAKADTIAAEQYRTRGVTSAETAPATPPA